MKRRSFVKLAGTMLLAGCAKVEESSLLNRVFDWFAQRNDQLGGTLFSKSRLATEYSPEDVTPDFKNNYYSFTPVMDPATYFLQAGRVRFVGQRVLLEDNRPVTLREVQAFAKKTQITELRCVEGWSAIAKWGGAPFSAFLETLRPTPEERYIFFYAADEYFDFLDIETAYHPQTLLCYEMSDQPLTPEHGGPLRLIAPTKIGYKNVKGIVLLGLSEVNLGGYWDRQGYPWHYGL